MKLKSQFLSLPAVLAMGMATTSAWAADVTLSTDGGSVNIPQTGTDIVTIADGVTAFKVYDYGGPTGKFEQGCSGFVVLNAPEGSFLRISGTITRSAKSGTSYGAQPIIEVWDGASSSNTTEIINAKVQEYNISSDVVLDLPTRLSSGNSLYMRFWSGANSGNLASDGLDMTIQVLKKNSTAAIDIYKQDNDGYGIAKINGDYAGSDKVSISTAINVDSIVYNRTFTAGTPSTIVLPFQLPAGAETNGKFYRLKKIVQVDGECRWKATMTWIRAKDETALPAANTPYAVIVPSGTKLWFKLNGNKTAIQTGTLVNQVDATGMWTFKGTYEYKAWESADDGIGLDYAIAKTAGDGYKAGDFVKVGAGSSSAPMRAYISKDPNMQLQPVGNARPLAMGEVRSIDNLPESIDVEFVDEDEKTTAIGRLNTVTGAIKIDRWFDLKGRSTNHKPTTKGAFFNKKGIAK